MRGRMSRAGQEEDKKPAVHPRILYLLSLRRRIDSMRGRMSRAGQEEDKKPAVHPAGFINLKVQDQDRNEVFFMIKRSAKLKTLMDAYCDRQCIDFKCLRFLFDGVRLRGEQTPEELEMEDGDEIDAVLHQYGGGVTI